jgi:Spy/CpxP family protein refolding chaperone
MMKSVRFLLVPALVLAIAIPLMAGEGKGKRPERKEAGQKGQQGARILPNELLKDLDLTAEQEAKLKAIAEEFKGQFQEVHKAVAGILTEEQKAAKAEAEKAAKEAGKTGKDLREAVEGAVTLTDAQKAKMAEVKKQMADLEAKVREKLMPVLTPEQQEAVKAKLKTAKGGEKKARTGKREK